MHDMPRRRTVRPTAGIRLRPLDIARGTMVHVTLLADRRPNAMAGLNRYILVTKPFIRNGAVTPLWDYDDTPV
jgi:hypothetical protein